MTEKFMVRKAAVLGAGVMGAQIAAQLSGAVVADQQLDRPAAGLRLQGQARRLASPFA